MKKTNIFKLILVICAIGYLWTPKHAAASRLDICYESDRLYSAGFEYYMTNHDSEAGRLVSIVMETHCMQQSGDETLCLNIFYEYFDMMFELMIQEYDVDMATEALGLCGMCQPGQTEQGIACVTCATGYYKEGTGSAPCTACPSGGTTSGTAASNHDSITDCYITSGSDSSGTFSYTSPCYYTK